jgi:hypothetical protein
MQRQNNTMALRTRSLFKLIVEHAQALLPELVHIIIEFLPLEVYVCENYMWRQKFNYVDVAPTISYSTSSFWVCETLFKAYCPDDHLIYYDLKTGNSTYVVDIKEDIHALCPLYFSHAKQRYIYEGKSLQYTAHFGQIFIFDKEVYQVDQKYCRSLFCNNDTMHAMTSLQAFTSILCLCLTNSKKALEIYFPKSSPERIFGIISDTLGEKIYVHWLSNGYHYFSESTILSVK